MNMRGGTNFKVFDLSDPPVYFIFCWITPNLNSQRTNISHKQYKENAITFPKMSRHLQDCTEMSKRIIAVTLFALGGCESFETDVVNFFKETYKLTTLPKR